MSRRRLLIAPVVVAVALGAAAPAEATLRLRDCGRVDCGRLAVPLDHRGAVPGKLPLYMERMRALRRPRRGATVLLAGGPGQPATLAFDHREFSGLTPRNDIVIFDQRGTGGSGLLRCRDLEAASALDAGREAEACAAVLGRRRGLYRSVDTVADIELLRRALGVERLTLVGVSYGTQVAQLYAHAYPARVERLVLDSVLDVTGVDPLYLDTFAAVPRVLRALCRSGCRRFSRDRVADLERLVAQLSAGPLRGYVVGERGGKRRAQLTRQDLLFTLTAGDLDDISRAAFPAAVVSALGGDPAPILRLKRRAVGVESGGSARDFSAAVYAATLCEEVRFPWPRFGSAAERPAAVYAAAALTDPALLRPFDAITAAGNDLVRLCRRWPEASPAPAAPGPAPDVPVLLVEGEGDLRTPVEIAEQVAARYPRSRLLVAPDTGHSALTTDLSGCTQRALARFLRGRRLQERCPRPPRRLFPPTPPLPASLRQLPSVQGIRGTRGRVVKAVELTLIDVAEEFLATAFLDFDRLLAGLPLRGAGLRGGSFRLDLLTERLMLDRVELVPGVRVSGVLGRFGSRRPAARLRVSGPAGPNGRLVLRDKRVRGRLGGRKVRGVIRIGVLEAASASAARAAARRAVAALRRRAPAAR